MGEWNAFPDRDGSLFIALDFSRGGFNESGSHGSVFHRCVFLLSILPILPLLVKGVARWFEAVFADGTTVTHLRSAAGSSPLTLFSLCFLAVISLRIPWDLHSKKRTCSKTR